MATKGAKLTTPSSKTTSSFGKNGGEALGTNRSTGASFTQTGAATKNQTYQVGAKASNPAPTQAATPTRPTPSVGLLSPADQLALAKWNTGVTDFWTTQANNIAGKYTDTQNSIGADNLSTANSKDLSSQSAAARGMFNSSIQTNNMADLDASLALRINTLNTNYNTYVSNQTAAGINETGLDTATQNYYTGLETTAAQNLDTNPPPAAAAPAQGLAHTPAAQTTAAGQAAQHPISNPAGTSSTGASLTTPSSKAPGASLTTPSQSPKAPKLPSSSASAGKGGAFPGSQAGGRQI